MTLRIEEIANSVFHITTKTQYELTSTFMRAQEYYESPYPQIRGHFFTHEQYIDTCAHGNKRSGRENTTFTYFEDWAGFNLPGNIFNKWIRVFTKKGLWKKEQQLVDLVQTATNGKKTKFYVIGTYSDTEEGTRVIDHELSHAWYYLDPEYKSEMQKHVRKLSKTAKQQMKRSLKKAGYTPEVYDDEIVAHLATNPMTYTAEQFEDVKIPWDTILKFQQAFEEYKDEHLDEAD